MSRFIERWTRFWDRHEPGDALAWVRIAVGLTLFCDFMTVGFLGLVPKLWGPLEEQGFGPASYEHPMCLAQRWFGVSTSLAWVLFALGCVSSLCLALGFYTRCSAALLVLVAAQLSQIQPDRGIDNLLRSVCVLLAFSGAGTTLALDVRLKSGRWCSDHLIPAWPRYLLILQIALLYFQAGILKQSAQWTSLDGYSALAVVLQRPHFSRFIWPPWLIAMVYPLLQLSTIVTLLFERGALLLPLLCWLHETRYRGGRLRTLTVRSRILPVWIGIGVTFHLGLAVLLQLGIFPWGCLALYPALGHPFALRRFLRRSRQYVNGWARSPA